MSSSDDIASDGAASLSDNEREMRFALKAGRFGTWRLDLISEELTTSETCRTNFGRDPAQPFTYAELRAAVHPDDSERMTAEVERSISTGADYDIEYRILTPTGETRWVQIRAQPSYAEDGRPYRMAGVSIDVTDRKRTEDVLAATQATLQAVYDNTPVGLIVAELPSGRLVEGNRTLQDIFRHPMHPTESMADYGVWESYDAAGKRTQAEDYPLFRTFATGEIAEGTYQFVRGDGTRAWLRVQTAPIRDTAGTMTGGVVAVTDVDEMMRTREALEQLSAGLETEVAERTAEMRRYHDIVEATVSPICAFDTDYRLIAFNQAHSDEFFRIFGHRVQLGEVFPDLFPPDQAPTMRGFMARALAGESYTVVEEFGDPALVKPYWEVTYTPLRDTTGRVIGAFHFANDITSRLRAKAELEVAQDALRQSQKMEAIGQLTGGVAHDFNNLLTVIRGSVDLLRRPELSDERRTRYIDAIGETADRAARLTGQLLAFARRQALTPELFDVGASIEQVGGMVRTLAGSRIDLELKPPLMPLFVMVDRTQLDTAIVNLAINARDAMHGEGKLTIAVGAVSNLPARRAHDAKVGDFVAIAITDEGSGIAAEDIERVFEPFYTTKAAGHGTGLGLSQVIGFAKQSGGDVTVESEPGRGTTFTMYLPRVAEDGDALAPERTEVRGDGTGVCVLLVEDNPEVGDFATSALEELGFDSVLARNGAEALAELKKDCARFHVLFTDVVMPGIDGIELARHVREIYPHLPIILTSGYSHVLAENGSHGFELLHKPYSVDQLARVLHKAIAWHDRADLAPAPGNGSSEN